MEPLQACLQTAKDAGCPKEQAQAFLQKGYVPYPWQWRFHAAAREADLPNGPVDIGLGGARGPGKSHAVLSQSALDDCQRVQGLKGLFLRQTGLAAKESFDDLVIKVVRGRVPYERTGNILRFPNTGCRIILGGFKDEKDIDKYIGIEYDFIIVEELNQLTLEKYEKLRGSLRTSKPNWRPRMYTSFNPGGIGHAFVKERYVVPMREFSEKETRFVPSTYKENPNLNPEYIQYLEGLTGDLGKAWREGDFDLFAGQYFSEWRYGIHVCQPFAIPSDWRKFVMGDYGYSKPSAIYWGAVSPDEQLFIYRELYETGLNFKDLTDAISASTPEHEDIRYVVFDPAIWKHEAGNENSLTGAEIMQNRWREINKSRPGERGRVLNLQKGDNNRLTGWLALREYLKPYHRGENLTAKLQVFSTCTELIRTLPSLIHDEHRVEDLDTDGEDHAADAIRYGVTSRPRPSATREEIAKREFNEMIKRKRRGLQRDILYKRAA